MAMQLRLGGEWKEILGVKVFSGGAWRTIQAIKVYADGAWRDAANFTAPGGGGGGGGGPMSISLGRSSITARSTSSIVSTANVTATPSGGLAPYTYSWVKQSGGNITAGFPSSATTTFRATGMIEDEQRTAVFRCTCTDSLGSTATADITATCTRIASGGSS